MFHPMHQIHLRYFNKFYDRQISYHPNIFELRQDSRSLCPIEDLSMSHSIRFLDPIDRMGKSKMHSIQ